MPQIPEAQIDWAGLLPEFLQPAARWTGRTLGELTRPIAYGAQGYGPDMVTLSDLADIPQSKVGVGLTLASMVPGGRIVKAAKAAKQRSKVIAQAAEAVEKNPALAQTFEEKFNYSGPMEDVPFPQYNWREHDFIIPGVDVEQALAKGQRVKVPLSELNAQQKQVRAIDLEHITSEPHPPIVVQKGGRLWIQDGHHRLAQAYKRGDKEATILLVNKD